jgi:DsbC/DsbD-like thiol-disulfide interchange protein
MICLRAVCALLKSVSYTTGGINLKCVPLLFSMRGESTMKRLALCAAAALLLILFERHDVVSAANEETATTLTAEDVEAKIVLSNARPYSGAELGVAVDFAVAPGWHIYGQPLPEGYTATSIKFDDALISSQSIDLPKPTPVKFEVLNETLPVYQGNFRAKGKILLKQKLPPGDHQLTGTLEFQECNDSLCKMPHTARFEIPITIEALTPDVPKS